MNGYYQQIVDLIKAHKGYLVRTGKGSHEIWSCNRKAQAVPFHCPSRHTANDILKRLGIPHRF